MEEKMEEKRNRKYEKKDEIIARKLRFSENPSSIVVAPKTKEGHILAKILLGFDRAVSRLRIRAGTYIGLQEAVEALKKGNEFISFLREVTSLLGNGGGGVFYGAYQEDLETKKMLAKKYTTYIILPKTNEAKEITLLLKRFDPLLLQFRSTCTDFSKSEDVFRKTTEVITRFDALVKELSSLVKTSYETPKGMELFVSYGMSGASSIPVVEASLGEAIPRKGKRVGGTA